MPKRRRLLTPMKKKSNAAKQIVETESNKEVSTPRGRLKGALLYALDPVAEDSDTSIDQTPVKRESRERYERDSSDDERRRRSPQRQSYVLKLFDRSVDLSQFDEDSPLYPICRAWIINQPKADYRRIGKVYETVEPTEDSVELPGPDGPVLSRIPELLPEQLQRSKDNINLDYREAPPPSPETLLHAHGARWRNVRCAWLRRAARVEARYADSQELLTRINVNSM